MRQNKRNATPKIKYLQHGGHSLLLRDRIDGRTSIAKLVRADAEALMAFLDGEGDALLPQRILADQTARVGILADVAWAALMTEGVFNNGEVNAAFNAFISAVNKQEALLKTLGLERRMKSAGPEKTLKELLDEDRD